jgi:ribonuclease Y
VAAVVPAAPAALARPRAALVDFPGIDKVYAIQAGREVRVFVKPGEIDDYAAHQLAKDIAHKIEQELQYPGEIRVTVLRETRIVEYAR